MEDLFSELELPLTRRLTRIVGDHAAAEDLRQEAFARAWTSAARAALAAAHKEVSPRERPLILVLAAHAEDPRPYERWIEAGGGEARVLDRAAFERDIATADGLALSGSMTDIDPALYGQPNVAA